MSARLTHLDDVIRFNEAIDQALAESVSFFSAQVDQARNLLLGMLGHDMRSPLQTIQMTASYLAALNAGAKVSEAASRLINSGTRMKALWTTWLISIEPSWLRYQYCVSKRRPGEVLCG